MFRPTRQFMEFINGFESQNPSPTTLFTILLDYLHRFQSSEDVSAEVGLNEAGLEAMLCELAEGINLGELVAICQTQESAIYITTIRAHDNLLTALLERHDEAAEFFQDPDPVVAEQYYARALAKEAQAELNELMRENGKLPPHRLLHCLLEKIGKVILEYGINPETNIRIAPFQTEACRLAEQVDLAEAAACLGDINLVLCEPVLSILLRRDQNKCMHGLDLVSSAGYLCLPAAVR